MHTVFGEAMVDAFARSNQSLHTIVDAVRAARGQHARRGRNPASPEG
jgi:hypothetical protein